MVNDEDGHLDHFGADSTIFWRVWTLPAEAGNFFVDVSPPSNPAHPVNENGDIDDTRNVLLYSVVGWDYSFMAEVPTTGNRIDYLTY